MDKLYELSMPWWQFVIRGALAYIGLLILLRLAGKRSFGEMAPFDIVVLILVGGTLRTGIVGDDKSLLGPFIAVATIILIYRALGWMTARSPRFNRIVEGHSVVIARHGKPMKEVLRRHDVPDADFARELRLQGVGSLECVDEARLEPNGKISVLRRQPASEAAE